MLAVFQTGVQYQIYHALGLFAGRGAVTSVSAGNRIAYRWLVVAGRYYSVLR
ncbi:DUF423 domain-containing protein [Pseudidiomarina halophila]|uniref:DUF423 domain-containing protein n=1 Tax=Pseudidiomarina halophila TaxID=1449799 RepID=UPI00361E8455